MTTDSVTAQCNACPIHTTAYMYSIKRTLSTSKNPVNRCNLLIPVHT